MKACGETVDVYQASLKFHRRLRGKLSIQSKVKLKSKRDLSLAYTPGVAQPCLEIQKNPQRLYDYTIKGNCVAVISDGSAVLGLGNIGAKAALPVMEGKAILFKEFAGIDAFPVCIDSQDPAKLVETIRLISPVFGGINLEDISAPRCFEVETQLQDLGIPVMHDDQHGTSTVVYAALINALKVVKKDMGELKVAISGAGAAGLDIARVLLNIGQTEAILPPVKEVILCDSKGAVHRGRTDLNPYKQAALAYTNNHSNAQTLEEALVDADVFIGVSVANLLNHKHIASMARKAIVFAMANPAPEILPGEAKKGGAAVIATGRSDYPNQVNNVLAFPGLFRGALDSHAMKVTMEMREAASMALAGCVKKPTADRIVPYSLEKGVASVVAKAVVKAVKKFNVPVWG